MKYSLLFYIFISSVCGFSQEHSKDKNINELDSFAVYKGCNENLSFLQLKECTTRKIKNFIQLSFNTELADKLFPNDKSTQFLVEFTINEKGKTENINAKAHKQEIAAEAIRIVKRLPKFKKPAFANGKPIAVSYSVLMTIYF